MITAKSWAEADDWNYTKQTSKQKKTLNRIKLRKRKKGRQQQAVGEWTIPKFVFFRIFEAWER